MIHIGGIGSVDLQTGEVKCAGSTVLGNIDVIRVDVKILQNTAELQSLEGIGKLGADIRRTRRRRRAQCDDCGRRSSKYTRRPIPGCH